MKKLCSLLLVLCLLFPLSACGGNKTETDNDTGSSTTQNQTDVTDTSSTEQNTDTPSSTTNNSSGSDSTDVSSSTASKPNTAEPDTSKPTTTEPESTKPSTPAHTHSYSDATCTAPAKCSCGETSGSALGHSYSDATCTEAKKCTRCGATNGNALGHSYSDATCTEAKKCTRCGATNGNALGHKWQDATCKALKTCSVCKVTEGNIGSHKYIDGYCIYCNEMLTIKTKVGFKENADYYDLTKYNDGTYSLNIWNFSNSQCGVRAVYTTDKEYGDINDCIVYKGITLYGVGFGGPMPQYTVTENEIIIKYIDEDILEDFPEYASEEYKFAVNYNYDLVCVYSNSYLFKKGDVLDLVE